MYDEIVYQLALTLVPNIGTVHAKTLVEVFRDASAIFAASAGRLEHIDGIGTVRAAAIKNFRGFDQTAQEIAFIGKHNLKALFIGTSDYPARLMNCYDPPTILYAHGNADLNAQRFVSIVGTRNKSEYGKAVTEKLVRDLAAYGVTVISGLALGIDAVAHKSALRECIPTIAVLAHGLSSVYPPEHTSLAREILRQKGSLLTEFGNRSKPDKHNFPTRNRIVAGLSDATVVIESGLKGGSMITAEIANGYNRDVFAIPGKVTDSKSSGCNALIRYNKAMLLTSAEQLIETMGWENERRVTRNVAKELLPDLSADESLIVKMIADKGTIHIDQLRNFSGFTTSLLSSVLLELEMRNIISSLPGKMYAMH